MRRSRRSRHGCRYTGLAFSDSSDRLRLEQEFAAFLGAYYLQRFSTLCREFASGFHHRVHCLVVVTRVVMKEQQRLNFCFQRERNGAGDRAVSPADVSLVLFVPILRVENQNVAYVKNFMVSPSIR